MRIDRNALAGNRTRRNWQRLDVSTATTAIQLNPASNNVLISTGQGYAVFVDSTGGIQNTSEGLALDFIGEGSLLTIDSTGAVTYLAAGSVGQVLTISSTTSTELSWQTPSTTGGGSTAVLPVVSSNPVSPTIGQAWYNSTNGESYLANSLSSTANIIQYLGIWASGSVQASTTALLLPDGLSIPAGAFNTVGRTLRLSVPLQVQGIVANTWTLYLSTNGGLFTLITLPALIIGQEMNVYLTLYVSCGITGSTGQMNVYGTASYINITNSTTGFSVIAGHQNPINWVTSTIIGLAAQTTLTSARDLALVYGSYAELLQ